MDNSKNLKTMSVQALSAVISAYPWFGAARLELCRRTGGSDDQFADAAMYMASRRKLSRALMGSRADCSDKDVAELVRSYLSATEEPQVHIAPNQSNEGRKVVVVGGDYFSKSDYEKVRGDEQLQFSPATSGDVSSASMEVPTTYDEEDFYTETLAQIYADQGYESKAIDIYSKLILAYPEKSVYFATLIEKLKN